MATAYDMWRTTDAAGDEAAAEAEEVSRRLSLLERDPAAIRQAIEDIEHEFDSELMALRVSAYMTNQDADRKALNDRVDTLITSKLLIRAKCEADEAFADLLQGRRIGAQS